MKFLVLYIAPISAREQMTNAGSEQVKAGMDAWGNWAKKAGDAIMDLGAPLDKGRSLNAGTMDNSSARVVGYSILQADSVDRVTALLQDHPHGRIPGFSIEVFECLSMPSAGKQPSQAA